MHILKLMILNRYEVIAVYDDFDVAMGDLIARIVKGDDVIMESR